MANNGSGNGENPFNATQRETAARMILQLNEEPGALADFFKATRGALTDEKLLEKYGTNPEARAAVEAALGMPTESRPPPPADIPPAPSEAALSDAQDEPVPPSVASPLLGRERPSRAEVGARPWPDDPFAWAIIQVAKQRELSDARVAAILKEQGYVAAYGGDISRASLHLYMSNTAGKGRPEDGIEAQLEKAEARAGRRQSGEDRAAAKALVVANEKESGFNSWFNSVKALTMALHVIERSGFHAADALLREEGYTQKRDMYNKARTAMNENTTIAGFFRVRLLGDAPGSLSDRKEEIAQLIRDRITELDEPLTEQENAEIEERVAQIPKKEPPAPKPERKSDNPKWWVSRPEAWETLWLAAEPNESGQPVLSTQEAVALLGEYETREKKTLTISSLGGYFDKKVGSTSISDERVRAHIAEKRAAFGALSEEKREEIRALVHAAREKARTRKPGPHVGTSRLPAPESDLPSTPVPDDEPEEAERPAFTEWPASSAFMFFHPASGRETMDTLTPVQYAEYWRANRFSFQRNGMLRPGYYPTLEEAERFSKK